MDTVLKGLAEVLLVGGTVGAYAMISVILLIVGYFKYLKPFLQEFYELRHSIGEFKVSHTEQSSELSDIKYRLEEIKKLINFKGEDLLSKISSGHKDYYIELRNTMSLVEKEILVLLDKTDKIQTKDDSSQRDLMVEIAKLQTRLEFMSPLGLGGIRK